MDFYADSHRLGMLNDVAQRLVEVHGLELAADIVGIRAFALWAMACGHDAQLDSNTKFRLANHAGVLTARA